ncbi:DUF3899 domain-containing protein [Alkalihalobacillus sp. TS-13]|uniref:DUF3899 domain-containing protein n=1 Tax=Alkalihalobacillus sp. TS-13 TaxID=2842455 RepID=UPI001C8732C3|nr:DUF3899 domain-containing protein [Alkalihalobacillus sp. TS-13]
MISYILSIITSITALTVGTFFLGADKLMIVDFAFFWGLICMTVGACFYVLQTGFLDLFFEGFKKLSAVAVPKSRSFIETDKQLKKDPSLMAWKQSVFLKGKSLFLGIGSGMMLFSFTSLLFI